MCYLESTLESTPYAEQSKFLPPFLIHQVLQFPYCLGDPLLDSIQLFSFSLKLYNQNWAQNSSCSLTIVNYIEIITSFVPQFSPSCWCNLGCGFPSLNKFFDVLIELRLNDTCQAEDGSLDIPILWNCMWFVWSWGQEIKWSRCIKPIHFITGWLIHSNVSLSPS